VLLLISPLIVAELCIALKPRVGWFRSYRWNV